jgi:hypothetical protein
MGPHPRVTSYFLNRQKVFLVFLPKKLKYVCPRPPPPSAFQMKNVLLVASVSFLYVCMYVCGEKIKLEIASKLI